MSADVALPQASAADTSDARRRYRRRLVARRARTATGVLAASAGAAASIGWRDADPGRLALFGGAMFALILAWRVLRRVLR